VVDDTPPQPRLAPRRSADTGQRQDAALQVSAETPEAPATVVPELTPEAETQPATRVDDTPEVASAAPRERRIRTETPRPEPVREDAATRRELPPAADTETIAEIEARLNAARRRREEEMAVRKASESHHDAPMAQPERMEAPVADIDEIADAVTELPSPADVSQPRDTLAPDASDLEDIARLEPAKPVKPAPAATMDGPNITDEEVAEIERRMAELKRQRDRRLQLEAKAAAPRVVHETKVEGPNVVQIDRTPQDRIEPASTPATAPRTERAADDDINPLLRPVGARRVMGDVDSLDGEADAEPVEIAAVEPRSDDTPGPMLRTDRRGPQIRRPTEPVAMVDLPKPQAPKSASAATGQARVTSLADVPESVQNGWPAEGQTLQGGVNRILSWLPKGTQEHTFVELQFSSDGGRKWMTVANGLRQGRAAMWNVPKISSENCKLRIIGRDGRGGETVLAVSEPFKVDSGLWETVDLSSGQKK
jgi:hypothetical protein